MNKRCPNIQQVLLCDCPEDKCQVKKDQKKLLTEIMEADAKDGLYETWEDIEKEYMKDEYPVFGGPFNNAMTPFEWLKKYYYEPKRK
jgi:hypothetical protein